MPTLPLRSLARRAPLVALLAVGCARGASSATPDPRPAAPDASPADTLRPAPGLVALGDSVFHGRVAGALCAVCHGQRGGGTPRGASLRDSTWLHVDGSYASILRFLATGMPTVRAHASPMLPRGGAELTAEQTRAVAAYVVSLGRGPR